jgi:DNA repair exonuclease SbcCD nuclease subunit
MAATPTHLPPNELLIVHAADVHLGSPLRGLDAYESALAELARQAPLRALGTLVDAIIESNANVLLIAGDLLDGDCDVATLRQGLAELARARNAGCEIIIIRGNHDAESRLGHALDLPAGIHELPTNEPGRITLDALGIEVVGQGYAAQAVNEPMHHEYPAPRPDLFSIAMLHTGLEDGGGHARYAPARLDELIASGYDYWALGHIHLRKILHQEPWVVFPGALQGRHARELGPHGAAFVRINTREKRVVDVAFRNVDVLRWEAIHIDATALTQIDDIFDLLRQSFDAQMEATSLPTIARVIISGRTELHEQLTDSRTEHDITDRIRSVVAQHAQGRCFIERVRITTTPPLPDLDALRTGDDPIALLLRTIDELESGRNENAALLQAPFERLRSKLSLDLRTSDDARGIEGIGELDEAYARSLLPNVRALLLEALAGGER